MNIRTRYRNPRIPFSTIEVTTLERKFLQSPYLGSNDVNQLAAILNMSPKRVSSNNTITTIEILLHALFFYNIWFYWRIFSKLSHIFPAKKMNSWMKWSDLECFTGCWDFHICMKFRSFWILQTGWLIDSFQWRRIWFFFFFFNFTGTFPKLKNWVFEERKKKVVAQTLGC